MPLRCKNCDCGVKKRWDARLFFIRRTFIPTITKMELEEYKQMSMIDDHEKIITVDGLRIICDGLNRDPEAIGKHFLEVLMKSIRKEN